MPHTFSNDANPFSYSSDRFPRISCYYLFPSTKLGMGTVAFRQSHKLPVLSNVYFNRMFNLPSQLAWTLNTFQNSKSNCKKESNWAFVAFIICFRDENTLRNGISWHFGTISKEINTKSKHAHIEFDSYFNLVERFERIMFSGFREITLPYWGAYFLSPCIYTHIYV